MVLTLIKVRFIILAKKCKNIYAKKRYLIWNPTTRYRQYKANAEFRGYVFELDLDDFKNLTTSRCHYCGDKDLQLGYDRIDNQQGYIKMNVVPCCWTCNHMKYKFSTEEWMKHMEKILAHQTTLSNKDVD